MSLPAPTALAAGALVINAFVWGVSWWPFRELEKFGLHPLWATALVYLLATVMVLAWRPLAWRSLLAHPGLWLLAVASGMTNIGFNWAVTLGDVVRVVLLFYLMPAWSVLVAWALLGEKPSTASLLRLALALAGVVIVLKTPGSPWPLPQSTADWLALMGGLCFAFTNVLLLKHGNTPSEGRMLAMFGGGTLMAGAAALAGMAAQVVPAPLLAFAGWPLAMALCAAFLISNLALQYGAARLAASTTALVMLTELLFATVSSAWLGAAELSLRTLMGGALIVLAAMLAALAPSAQPAAQADDGREPDEKLPERKSV